MKKQQQTDTATTTITTEIVVQPDTSSAIAVVRYDTAALRQLIEEIYGGPPQPGDFERVRMPGDGTEEFTIMTPAGEEHPRTLQVVILRKQRKRAFWAHAYTGKGVPSDCHSKDGRVGEGDPGGECLVCPHAHFRDDGSAPKCTESMDLTYFVTNEDLPSILAVHKMSVQAVERYARQLRRYRLAVHAAVTELGLKSAQYRNGFGYTQLTLRTLRVLTPTEHARVRANAAAFGIEADEVLPAPTAEEASLPDADIPF
jgi:hypothetical protein